MPWNCALLNNEYNALFSLYNATRGNSWTFHTSNGKWNFSGNLSAPCGIPWEGVTCAYNSTNTKKCNVVSIVLDDYNMTGYLPSSLSALKSLSTIDFLSNYLTGPLPSSWSSLSALTFLRLNANNLEGALPTSWYSLSNLVQLRLAYNSLTGQLPSSWSTMTKLNKLTISANSFTGTLPSVWGSFTRLQYLSLRECFIDGSIPDTWSTFVNIQEAYLYGNSLTGTLPTWISAWTSIVVLQLHENSFMGTLPSQWGPLSVQLLSTYLNNVWGVLPATWSDMQMVNTLILSYNIMSGTLPASWSSMTTIDSCVLTHNSFDGTLPSQWSSWANITNFGASFNQLTGRIPTSWSSWSNIVTLGIVDNHLTGTLPVSWSTYSYLTDIKVNGNMITGRLPSSWSSMSSLIMLYMASNSLSGSIPSAWDSMVALNQLYACSNNLIGNIRYFPEMKYIRLDDNLLSGKLSISGMVQMEYCNISHNYLSGKFFAQEKFIYPNLSSLDVSMNQFSGSVPGQKIHIVVPNVNQLSLSENCFTGSIHSDLCNLDTLNVLIMDNMAGGRRCSNFDVWSVYPFLSGTLPTCLFSISALNTLHIMGNGLKGTLPEISPDSLLTVVSLMSNYLTGTLPNSWQRHGSWQQLLLSYNKIYGTLISDFPISNETMYMNLSVNRLSGGYPTTFATLQTCDVLEGNVFSCQPSRYENDVNSDTYSCASQPLSYVLYGYISMMIMVFLAITHKSSKGGLSLYGLIALLDSSPALTRILLRAGSILILILIVRGALFGGDPNSTEFVYIYGWVTTVVYIHGLSCIALLILVLILFGIVTFEITDPNFDALRIWKQIDSKNDMVESPSRALSRIVISPMAQYAISDRASVGSITPISRTSSLRDSQIAGIVDRPPDIKRPLEIEDSTPRDSGVVPTGSGHDLVPNSSIMSGTSENVNILFELQTYALLLLSVGVVAAPTVVYITVILERTDVIVQLVFAIFLALFKVTWTAYAASWMLKRTAMKSFTKSMRIELWTGLVSFLLCPLLIILMTDVNCFKYAITSIPSVEVSYTMTAPDCYVSLVVTISETVYSLACSIAEFRPVNVLSVPWTYPYQCSSSFVTSYVAVVFYTYIIYAVIVPCLQVYFLKQSRAERSTAVKKFPAVRFLIPFTYPMIKLNNTASLEEEVVQKAIRLTASLHSRKMRHLVMLLMYGAAAPILGIFILVTIVMDDVLVNVQINILRNDLRESGCYEEKVVRSITSKIFTSRHKDVYRRHFPWYVMMSVLFWCMFTFDMFGDVFDWFWGLWAMFFFFVTSVIVVFFTSHNSIIEQHFGWLYGDNTVTDRSSIASSTFEFPLA